MGIERTLEMTPAESFTTLGLREGATKNQVRTAYRALAKTLHPDATGNNTDTGEFRTKTEAYKTAMKYAPEKPITDRPQPRPIKSQDQQPTLYQKAQPYFTGAAMLLFGVATVIYTMEPNKAQNTHVATTGIYQKLK